MKRYHSQPTEIVPEIDVLISCSLWLRERRVLPFQFSVAVEQGIDTNKDKNRLKETLVSSGMPASLIHFVSDGPDIVAVAQSEFWQIECR